MTKMRTLVSMLATAGLLTACGGGWWEYPDKPEAGAPAETSVTPTPTTPPPVQEEVRPAALALSGVVATGAALSGATVNVKCATGSSTATSGTDGSYTISITGGALPCVLEAESADKSVKLHSAIAAPAEATTAVTANVTPLTTLLVAQMVGANPATFFSDSAAASKLVETVTPTTVAASQTAVINTLKAAGIDTAAITNLVSQPLVAATGSTAGNAYDKVLDAVNATLKDAGTTFAALTATVAQTAAAEKSPTVAANAGGTEGSAPTGTATTGTATTGTSTGTTTGTTAVAATGPSLPADLLLKPKAATCDSLRSTTYRMVLFAPRSTGGPEVNDSAAATNTAVIDAKALTFTWTGQATKQPWTAHPADKCRFTNAENADIAISPAGVLVARVLRTEAGQKVARIAMGFPEQTVSVQSLAGKWNSADWDWADSTSRGDLGWNRGGAMATFEMAADGVVTSIACGGESLSTALASCKSQPALSKFSANAAGGFNISATDTGETFNERVFAYRAGNGATMLLGSDAHGHAYFSTRVRTNGLPTVGQTSTTYGFNLNAALLGTDVVSATRWTATSVDAAAGSFVRSSLTVGRADNTAQPQTIVINRSRNGYSYRQPGPSTALDGATSTVREFYALGLGGMGISAVILPRTNAEPNLSNALMSISVTPPVEDVTGTLRGDSLRRLFVNGTSYDDRVFAYVNTTASGIQGVWSLSATGSKSGPTLFFLANGEYVMLEPNGETDRTICVGPNNPNGGAPAGIEVGPYSFSGGRLTIGTPFIDTNGCVGLYDSQNISNNQGSTWTFPADGRTATMRDTRTGEVYTLYRLPR
jgi:hypothetical protein